MMKQVTLVCAGVCLSCANSALAVSPEALAGAREAAAAITESGVRIEGSSEMFGSAGQFSLTFGTSGEFRMVVDNDLLIEQVFDGETLWEKDWHGNVRTLYSGERESLLLQMSFLNGTWANEHGPLELGVATADGDGIPFVLRDGLLRGTIVLNEDSMPARVTTTTTGAEYTFEFTGYTADPILHPSVVKIEGPQGNTTTLTIESVAKGSSEVGFARPVGDDARVVWSGEAGDGRAEVMATRTGHHLVKALVNGEDLGWFIFDTGAGGTVLTPRVVEALGLKSAGSMEVGGVGGVVTSDLVVADSLTVGPMTLLRPGFITIDLSFLDSAFGVQVAGIVGYDVLARASVGINVKELSITIARPGVALDANWEECRTSSRVPSVRASVEGVSGFYRLDTGAARGTVSFHAPAVERLGLLDGRSTTQGSAGGVGGRIKTRSGQIDRFELAGHVWTDVSVDFAIEHVGALGDPYTDGNIGGLLLNRYVLWFDYTNERVGFVEVDGE